MNIPDKIKKLIETFDYNLEMYKKGSYNETQVRLEFINPFFEELGWDITNKQGHAEAYKEVIHEDGIKVGGVTKAPDYCFRIGGVRKFFLEAKKPAVNIKKDIHPAYQLRRYGWSAKLPLSILTDFEEFAVYDCRVKPAKTDKVSHSRILYMKYTDYIERWDEIVNIFSPKAILKGSFDKYVKSKKTKKGTAEVDTAFLQEIERWRELLARNIALRNPNLTQRELNFAVQQTIDRVIFLRICEDRGIEDYGRLMALKNGNNVYRRLFQLFRKADDKYNSGLFHFKKEKSRETFDGLTPNLIVDDNILKDIFKNLYYPDSPYEFSVLPADILGQVYEQFLGKIIRLTPKHQAKIEEKPEVRKAGGVYYTPTYIVNYIVKQTVGKLVEGKKPGPRGAVSKLKMLDPACGSGSFLLGAYQYLLDWHRDQYVNDDPEKWAKGKTPRLYQTYKGEWRLTTDERKRILLNNIYGVDIDPQAVEVTKLSLLLKVLEGEDEQSIGKQMTIFQERVLPDLANNIKCGNSLIGPDFHENRMSLLDEEEMYRVNVFDWNAEFPEIIKNGGFDAVIGNPPYGDYFNKTEKDYLLKKYANSFSGTFDIYINFFSLTLKILKNKGRLCFITPHTFLNYSQFSSLRQLLLTGNNISLIIQIKNVFEDAVVDNVVILITKSLDQKDNLKVGIFKEKIKSINDAELKTISSKNLSSKSFLIKTTEKFDINKLSNNSFKLSDYVKITQGITTGGNSYFIGQKNEFIEYGIDEILLKKTIKGKDIDRYKNECNEEYILYSTKFLPNIHQEKIANFLEAYKKKLSKKRETKQGKLPWYCLHWPRNENDFNKKKILIRQTASKIIGVFDNEGYYPIDTIHTLNLINDDNNSSKLLQYILGILNSKLFEYLYHWKLDEVGKVYPQIKKVNIEWLPIRKINFENSEEKSQYDQMVSLVNQMLTMNKKLAEAKTPQAKEILQRQMEATDKQIDQLVYELYDLTDEEIKIVESKS